MKESATKRLVMALHQLPASHAREVILREAKAFRYHDFKSPHDSPKLALVRDLTLAGFTELAERVKQGEFDEGKEEAEEWAESDEGKRIIADVKGEPPSAEPNLAAYDVFELEGYEVSEWTPLPDGKGKPQQVHLVLRAGAALFTLRMKTARAVNELVAALEKHRDGVWPQEGN